MSLLSKVIKSQLVKLKKPKVIAGDITAKVQTTVKTATGSEEMVKDDISYGFYKLLREKDDFRDLLQREKKLLALQRDRLEAEKRKVAELRADAEKAYCEQRKKGYEEGYSAGIEEGRKQYESIIDEAVELKKSLEAKKKAEIDMLEPEIIQLVLQSVEKIMGIKLEENDDLLAGVLLKGLEKLTYAQDIVVRACIEDMETLKKNEKKILVSSDGVKTITFKADQSLERGNVHIETKSGSIDAGIQTQMAAIREEFQSMLESGVQFEN